MKPRLLDLFCGEGGASVGYDRAGFDVVGVDLNSDQRDRRKRPRPRPLLRYPFPSVEDDALHVLEDLLRGGYVIADMPGGGLREYVLGDFAAIHASPPCQAYSPITRVNGNRRDGRSHPELIEPTRELLFEAGLPYVIENVPEAPLLDPILLCGSMFDMDVRRHRCFEANWPLEPPAWPCRHLIWTPRFPQRDYRRDGEGRPNDYLMSVVPVYGGTRFAGDRALRRRAMEIDWMTLEGLNEAIPPRWAEFIGSQLLAHVQARAA